MPLGNFQQQVRAFHDQTATGMFCCRLAEISQEGRVIKDLAQRPIIMDRLGRQLDHRAWFNIPPGTDVVSKPGRCWTECLPFTIVISVNDDDWLPSPHLDNELACRQLLLGR